MTTWRGLDAALTLVALRNDHEPISMLDLLYVALTLGLLAISLAMIRMFGRMT